MDNDEDESSKINPILISFDCFRLVFVDNYNWEDSENIFLINYKRL